MSEGEEFSELSSRERQIMDVIFRLDEATAREIQDELADPLANATIRTVLRILEEKGHLTHREVGRQFVYTATRPRNQVAKSAARRLVQVFFEGSLASAVSGMLDLDDLDLSDAELNELSEQIANARKSKKG